MRALALAAMVSVLAGCALDMSPPQPWRPIADAPAALAADIGAPPSQHAPTDRLRVVTYNVETGIDVADLAATITSDPQLAMAGLVLAQEEEAYPGEGATRTAQLAALLGVGYLYVPAREKDGGTHGLALLSPFPLANPMRMELPDAGKGRHRIAVACDVDLGGRTLHVIDVHLETTLDTGERIAQLSPAVVDAPDVALVGGDFNTSWVTWASDNVPVLSTTAASDQAPIVDDYMAGIAFDTPTAASGPTESMYGLASRLDSIYTRGLDVVFGGVVRAGPSDHWPMWLDVTVR